MKNSLNIMGVMNVTPNSFSDGGKLSNVNAIKNQLDYFKSLKVHYLDIGAESTAPMNNPIDESEEWDRLCVSLDILKNDKVWSGFISLDSYRPKTAFRFFKELKKAGISESLFVWNDVSGLWDDEVEKFLTTFEKARYVYCHNEVPERQKTSHHMDFLAPSEGLFDHLCHFFRKADLETFSKRVILDPCYGFSKNYQQNWAMIESFPDLLREFPNQDFVFGISKKSFLRQRFQELLAKGLEGELPHFEKSYLLEKSEILHSEVLGELRKKLDEEECRRVILRVHDPALVYTALC